VTLPDGYVWKDLTAQQRWYYKHREHRIKVKDERRARLQRWFYEFKRDEVACTRCREGRPRALDFHHTGEKEHAVLEMITDGYSKQRILEEIDRCIPLCVNCHRKEHVTHPACLDLHHETDKEMEVSHMISFGRSLREIHAEIRKCVVLCGNCHREADIPLPPEPGETDSV